MTEPQDQSEYTLPTNRIEALSDGVFSIVMTILVLELHVPQIPETALKMEFFMSLMSITPTVMYYMMSFIILGVYWVGHHKQFHYIQYSDRVLLWLNIFFLMFVALIPFSTKLLGMYPERYTPVLIYSSNMIFVALLLYSKWVYATIGHRLVRKNLPSTIIQRGRRKIMTGVFIYVMTIFVAYFWSVRMSLWLFALVPLLYILPSEWGWWKKKIQELE